MYGTGNAVWFLLSNLLRMVTHGVEDLVMWWRVFRLPEFLSNTHNAPHQSWASLIRGFVNLPLATLNTVDPVSKGSSFYIRFNLSIK